MERVRRKYHYKTARTARLLPSAMALAIAAVASFPRTMRAINVATWDGATGDWFDPSQWAPALVPQNNLLNTYFPIINAGSITLNNSITTSGFILGTPALLTLGSGNSYTLLNGTSAISGQIDLMAAALLDVRSDLILNNATISDVGTFRQFAGNLSLLGTSTISNLVVGGTGGITGPGSLTITNSWNWANDGTAIGGNIIIAPAAVVKTNSSSVTLTGHLTNNGTTYLGIPSPNFSSPGDFFIGASGLFVNNGKMLVEEDVVNLSVLNNAGLITNDPAAVNPQRHIEGPILNTGTISGSFILFSGTSSGVLSPDAGPFARTLTLTQFTLADGAIITSVNNGVTLATGALALTGTAYVDHLSFGAIQGPGTITVTGASTWTGGVVGSTPLNTPTIRVAPAGKLYIPGATILNAGTLTNDGTLYAGLLPSGGNFIYLGSTLQANAPSAAVINNGTFFDEETLTANMTNNGLITALKPDIVSQWGISGNIINNGTISGPFAVNNLSNFGVLSGDTSFGGKTLSLGPGDVLQDGSRITSIAGTVSGGSQLTIIGNVIADHFVFSSANTDGQDLGTLSLTGPNAWAGGQMTGPGETLVLPSGTLRISGPMTLFSRTFINQGKIDASGGASISILGLAAFYNQGTMTVPTGTHSGPGPFFNSGIMTNYSASGPGIINITAPFYNTGTITASGQNGGFAITNGSSFAGTFISLAGASMNLGLLQTPYILDNATLSGAGSFGGQVTLLGNNQVSNATFGITGPGALDVTGTLTPGSIGLGAFVRVLPTGTTSFGTSIQLVASTLVNQGNSSIQNSLTLRQGASFINQGVLTTTFSSFSLNASDPLGIFINAGTINDPVTISVGTGGTPTLGSFSNSGLISVSGFMTIGQNFKFYNTGTFLLTGSGRLAINGGGVISGNFSSSNANAQATFSGGVLLDNATLSSPASQLTVAVYSGSVTLAHVSTADTVGFANISGNGELDISNTLLIPTTLVVTGGAHLVMLSSAVFPRSTQPTQPITIDNAIFTNQGTISLYPFGPTSFTLNNGALFENQGLISDGLTQPTATFNLLSDNNTANRFNNTGTFNSNATATIQARFDNSGSVNLGGNATFSGPLNNTGILTAGSGNTTFHTLYIAGGGTGTGIFTTEFNNALSRFGSILFTAPYTLNNASLSGDITNIAPLTLLGNVTGGLTIAADLIGPGTFTGTAAWTAGRIANVGGLQLQSAAPGILTTVTANNTLLASGNLTLLPGDKTLDGINLIIPAGYSAAWSQSATAAADALALKNGAQIINHGTFYSYLASATFNAADNNSNSAFINTGTFGRSSLTPAAPTISSVTTFHIPFHNSGLVDIQQGFIDFAAGYFDDNGFPGNGGPALTPDIQFAPNTGLYFSGGNYDFGDAPFDLGSGGLKGTGTVHGHFISGGNIAPGNSPGILAINGDLSLKSTSTLTFEIAGTSESPAVPYDQLTVSGHLAIDGAFSLTLLNNFQPADTDIFSILLANNLTGTLANLHDGTRIQDNASTGTFLATYSPTSLTLSDFQPNPAPVPEPFTLSLLSSASIALLLRRRPR